MKKPISKQNTDKLDSFSYPANEDIYYNSKKESAIDTDNVRNNKDEVLAEENRSRKDFGPLITGEDLDVPGTELDDQQENIGSEDEENNYYSLGGDNHIDLEENNGE